MICNAYRKVRTMTNHNADRRTPERRAQDERIAAEPRQAPPNLPTGAKAESAEIHLARQGRRPLAVAGVVENGVVRPLDASVHLPENSRVIIVASEE